MTQALKVLVIEDSIDDMILMQYHFKKAAIDIDKFLRVDTAEDLSAALDNESWDLIISDFRLPRLNVLVALEIVSSRKLDLPFIIVSGRVGEEAAALALKAGAHDFVSKDSMSKLADVVRRELVRAKERRDRAQMEDQLHLVNLVFENTSEGILICDKDNNIIKANEAFTTITGYAEQDVIGKNPRVLSSGTMAKEFYLEMWNSIREKGHWSGEIINRKKNGDLISELLRINSVENKDGELTHYIAVLTDISEKKKAEQALIESNQKLQAAMENAIQLTKQAQEANLAKRDFLANMSHEIRTPMHVIIGLSELLAGSQLAPEQLDSVRMILKSSQLLLGIIEDVLDFSKIEAKALRIESVPFHMEDIVENLALMLRLKAKEKNLLLRAEIHSETSLNLIGDPLRIKQILLNFLSNALKFTTQGEIGIEVKLLEKTTDNMASLELAVWDTGIGIPSSLQSRIFQPFEQADSSTTRKYGGSGLGLAICKHLAEAMGGTIKLESIEGQGSRLSFHVRLPFDQAAQQAATQDHTNANEKNLAKSSEPVSYFGKTVLLAEDYEFSQILGARMLKKMGLNVEVAGTGKQAVEIVQSKQIDLILMDVQMPEMDGFEATRIIRADPRYAQLPIIAMTAHTVPEFKVKCFEAGMNDYLSKPLEKEKFFEKLHFWLRPNPTSASKSF